ncbi:Hypothetical predicted protein [Mytilus galloprovincialis]|uniref:EGF-like domain-containing protein n=1 Tax=Mytilus galloprovincialis TaxID=29158 RepID=A0A8B6F878_MYTGA|nr:Hypothetical predicted protein [Mytilus galloprovincialis]
MSYLSKNLKMKVIYVVLILLSYVEEYFSLHSSRTCKPCRSLCCLHGFCYQDIHTLKHKCACYRGFTGENCDTEP